MKAASPQMIDNPGQSQKEIDRVSELMADGVVLHRDGKIAEAKRCYREVLRIFPDKPEALHFLGIISHQSGRNREAIMHFRRAVEAHPDFVPAFDSLAKMFLAEKQYKEALSAACKALDLDQGAHGALRTMAKAYMELKQIENAYETYKKIDELFPGEAGTTRNIAICLSALKRKSEAVTMFQHSLDLDPEDVITRSSLADALNSMGAHEEALEQLNIILNKTPDYVPALVYKGVALDGLTLFDEAATMFERAVEINPQHAEAHFNLGLARLSDGDLPRGWDEYSWRLKTQAFLHTKPPTSAPIWQGEPLAGKSILMFPEQGMGDTIQFVRYARPLQNMGACVYCQSPKPLHKLLQTVEGANGVFAIGERLPDVDFQISMMELPRLFKTELHSIPAAAGYLKAPDSMFSRPDTFSVGIVWHGNPAHERDMIRSIPFHEISALFDLADVSFYSLQVGEGAAKILETGFADRVQDLSQELSDFSITAGIIANLDLVICVDTSVAHVTGALGKPLWLLLPTAADWRWGRTGTTTPWYSSMRVFRQTRRGDWAGVIKTVKHELRERISTYKH
ncbi:tetratricopeptide repeat protein [Thalassospiraceae bacterium LMO-JJ14]|nr:tetratricopeptide repeat protein [Thalassospiraceae bacterium LMO-JJ14]